MSTNNKNKKFTFPWWNIKNIKSAIKPIGIASFLLGLLSLSKNTNIYKKFLSFLYLLFWLIFYLYFLISNIKDDHFKTLSNSEIANNGKRFLQIIGLTICIIAFISSHYLQNRYEKLVQDLVDFDKKVILVILFKYSIIFFNYKNFLERKNGI